jgi:hypothetical protein
MEGADAAVKHAVLAKRDVKVDVACGERGPFTRVVMLLVESALNSRLEFAVPATENSFHSKSLVGAGEVGSVYFHKRQKRPGVSSFFMPSGQTDGTPSLDQGLVLDQAKFAWFVDGKN